MGNIKKGAVVVVGVLAGVSALFKTIKKSINYSIDVIDKRGEEYSASTKSYQERHGDYGKRLLKDLLLKKYDNVIFNKFVDNKNLEIDAILIENGHIILIQMKNWKGHIYGDDDCKEFSKDKTFIGVNSQYDIDTQYFRNPLKILRNRARILKETLGIDLYIDTLLVFGSESFISGVTTNLSNVCNILDIYNEIDIIVNKTEMIISDETINNIKELAEWDTIGPQEGMDIKCIIMDKTLEFRLYQELENEKNVEIFVDEIDKLEIKARKVFRKNKPDDIIVFLKDGTKKNYYNFSSKISIFSGVSNEHKKISISKIKYIKFSKTRPK